MASSMAGQHLTSKSSSTAFFLFLLLAFSIPCTHSARFLDEEAAPADTPQPAPADPAEPTVPVSPPTDTIADAPATAPTAQQQPTGPTPTAANSNENTGAEPHQPLTFFMHDILGGSNPSGRIVTGIVANSAANGQLPFSKPNKDVFPINGALPLPNGASGSINNNNIPFLAGLGGGSTSSIAQSNGNIINGGNTNSNNLPFVTSGNLPAGSTLQNLLFGTTTVIADELTEGHEIGSAVIGNAQGFYVASSEDGSSQTMMFTAMLSGGDNITDTIDFFGVHRTVSTESHVAVIGGTGKYENARGYAAIQTLHPTDQHTTDGVETLLQISVYLS